MKSDAKTQCLYGDSKCEVKRDSKHPRRWRPLFRVAKACCYCKVCQKK